MTRTPLQGLDPRVKIILAFGLMGLSFLVATPLQACVAVGLIALLIGLARLNPARFLLSSLPVVVPLVVVAALNLVVTRTGPVIWAWGPFSVTEGGFATAVTYGFRVALIVLYGALLLATTTPTGLTDAFASLLSPLRWVGVPVEELAFVLSLALRFVPTLADEFQAVREAQASRGGTVARGRPTQRLAALTSLVVPVLAASMRHADNLSLALDSRAWESGRVRTHWHPLRLRPRDLIACLVVAGYAALLVGLP